jgi:hypothetical protein
LNLTDMQKQFEELLKTAKDVDNKKDMKNLRNEAKVLCNSLKRIKEVRVEEALHLQYLMVDLASNMKIDSLLDRGEWLRGIVRELGSIQRKNTEVFMDAEAIRIRTKLGLPAPAVNEIVRFNVNLCIFPPFQKRQLLLEQTRKVIEVSLPILRYRGLAKLTPGLLCIDWIGGMVPKDNAYLFGPTAEDCTPKHYPLSAMTSLVEPSEDTKFDFDLLMASSTEIQYNQLRAFRKRNPEWDYHPLSEFLVRIKLESFKGESKENQQILKKAVLDSLKQSKNEHPLNIGWTFAYVRHLGTGFPPIMRGNLLPPGSSPLELSQPVESLPMTSDSYVRTVLNKFDEDNIIPHDDTIDDIPVVYGGRWVAFSTTTMTGWPYQLHSSDTIISNYIVTALGIVNNVSLERIKSFSNRSVAFAKSKLPKGTHVVVDIPVLISENVDAEAKTWVEEKFDKSYNAYMAPSILDLSKKTLNYCEKSVRYHIWMFIDRYLMTEEMKWKKAPPVIKITRKCPHCGALYRYDEKLVEVTCQNCLKAFSNDSFDLNRTDDN